jgi:chromosome segregation ATPase
MPGGRPRGAEHAVVPSRGSISAPPPARRPDRGRREATTGTARETTRLRERLARTQDQLRRVRATERVLVEQVAYLDEVAADAETRKLVAQTPLADREWREARTDLDRHTALLDETRREAAELLAEQDRLLERLFELDTPLGRDDT